MKWTETRKKLIKLAAARNGRLEATLSSALQRQLERGLVPSVRPSSICVASGKGGTGKSVVSASLATALARRGRTLILDADLGVGNAHILQDVSPRTSFVDVVEGRNSVREVLISCSDNLDLLAAGSGVPRMAELSAFELHLIASGLDELETEYRFLVVDSAAGVSHQTLAFAQACDIVLLVTTPDLTAMTDVYAFLKLLIGRPDEPLLVVNRARSEEEADEVFHRMARVCERFLGTCPLPVGWIPDDPLVSSCVNRRGSVVLLEPEAPFSRALSGIVEVVLVEARRRSSGGMGQRLLSRIGFSPRLA